MMYTLASKYLVLVSLHSELDDNFLCQSFLDILDTIDSTDLYNFDRRIYRRKFESQNETLETPPHRDKLNKSNHNFQHLVRIQRYTLLNSFSIALMQII